MFWIRCTTFSRDYVRYSYAYALRIKKLKTESQNICRDMPSMACPWQDPWRSHVRTWCEKHTWRRRTRASSSRYSMLLSMAATDTRTKVPACFLNREFRISVNFPLRSRTTFTNAKLLWHPYVFSWKRFCSVRLHSSWNASTFYIPMALPREMRKCISWTVLELDSSQWV